MDYNKLKKIISQKGFTIEKVCSLIDMTTGGFHYSVKNDTLKVKDLERICDVLGINIISIFSEEDKQIVGYDLLKNENDSFKKQLKDKEKIITLLENEVKQLKNK